MTAIVLKLKIVIQTVYLAKLLNLILFLVLQLKCVIDIVGMTNYVSAFGLLQLCQGIPTILGVPIAGECKLK